MKPKIHPHLKSFIHSVILSELGLGGNAKRDCLWQETLMREIQGNILLRLSEIRTQPDLERVTREEVQKIQGTFIKTLEMMTKTLGSLPLEVLRR